jgi:ferredoxin-NADP reductase
MKKHIVKIQETFFVTHDVKSFIVERPDNYKFEPGQATEVSINKDGWKDQGRPFTFTSLPGDDFLQFIIKTYPSHKGVTNELLSLEKGDELILHDVFGTITYQGKGTFIAGGAGVTPFISILRQLQKDAEMFGNRLIFANKTSDDIILKKEFEGLLGKDFINILSEEKTKDFHHGMIDKDYLEKNITGHTGRFYVCGPPPMNEAIIKDLAGLGIPKASIITEDM